ncbi:hypothetical protein [Streptomyces sp. PSAA01]|uniref:hypothetical protein n=1 Tax=Streptomyces sp. PSAA01 TaxID=2912762 RepID=UPI001F3F767F|nr:hypothetical protein [Streptomyces sp. PSAA01]MCG0290570.1 hypothetical protein [Streptomyces sp. PSAA01]
MEWVSSVEELSAGVLHFRRSTGRHGLSNLSAGPVPLPEGLEVVLASGPLDGEAGAVDRVPAQTTVWLR